MTTQDALKRLNQYKKRLTRQQLKTLRGQILAGDLTGAEKGLNKLTQKGGVEFAGHQTNKA